MVYSFIHLSVKTSADAQWGKVESFSFFISTDCTATASPGWTPDPGRTELFRLRRVPPPTQGGQDTCFWSTIMASVSEETSIDGQKLDLMLLEISEAVPDYSSSLSPPLASHGSAHQ